MKLESQVATSKSPLPLSLASASDYVADEAVLRAKSFEGLDEVSLLDAEDLPLWDDDNWVVLAE